MQVAIVTDSHFGARNDNIKILAHQEQFFTETFFPYLKEHDISTVMHLGDIYDKRKSLNTATSNKVRRFFLEKVKEYDFHYIIGNHDCHYKDTNDVNTPKEAMGEYTEFNAYHVHPKTINIGGTKIGMVPWISNQNRDEIVEFLKSTPATVIMGHFDIKGFAMYRGSISQQGFSPSEFKRFDMVLSGHYHHKSSSDNIHYLGSPYQMNWADYGDERGFHILDTETLKMKFVPNPVSMFQKIRYDDENMTLEDIDNMDTSGVGGAFVKLIVGNKTNPAILEALAEKLELSGLADLKIDDVTEQQTADSVDISEIEDLIDFLDMCAEEIEDETKSDVKQLLRALYMEVQND